MLPALALGAAGFAAAAAGFAGKPGVAPSLRVGVADDDAKFAADGGAAQFARMSSSGLSSLRVSVFWDPRDPTALADRAGLDRMVPAAALSGIQLVLALYPDPRVPGQAKALSSRTGAAAFCGWAAEVARAYPDVSRFIIGNEPNQPRFWQPQFNRLGRQLSGWQYEYLLATCYDALKDVNPAVHVIGVGLSPRGNDLPHARTNSSTSPVRFLQAMGAAYRASGRSRPLMDELSVHCYPNANTDALSRGYQWPNIGCVNFDRLKQAVWDAFNGTAQPTFAEEGAEPGTTAPGPTTTIPAPATAPAPSAAAGGCTTTAAETTTQPSVSDQEPTTTTTATAETTATTTTSTATTTTPSSCGPPAQPSALTLIVDETGWQARAAGAPYVGAENVSAISEAKQAAIYRSLVRQLACDPSVTALHTLYFRDSARLQDFQSGLLRADGSARPALAAVQSAAAAGCQGLPTVWDHLTTISSPRLLYSRRLGWRLRVGEGVVYRAEEYKAPSPAAARAAARALQSGYPQSPDSRLVAVRKGTYAHGTVALRLPRPRDGSAYVVAVLLRASANAARTAVLVSPPPR